jgi:hypothetical protein
MILAAFFTNNILFKCMIFIVIAIYGRLLFDVHRDTKLLKEVYAKSSFLVTISSKLITRYEEMKFLDPSSDL